MNLGAPELIIILAVVLLLFGSTRLPKLARSLGQASKEFKHGVNEGARDDEEDGIDDASRAQRKPKTGS
ncbi:MAG TPA: twin-arginine translocase TatA/TatE family subunit [Acidimicrobiales bacterium]|nr:twin-arginine translocase TatA/TatE family subunit [Acidimicrobiales bacterium]